MLFSITRWPQLLAPLEILMKWNEMKYIPIHSYCIFLAHQSDYKHDILQPWLPVSQKYKYELIQTLKPWIIHHKE